MIEASFAKQYGIRLRNESSTMPWAEFVSLVSGLMADTPLGQIVAIRAEKDLKTIKSFSADQRKIFNDWRNRKAKKALDNPEKLDREMNNLSKMLEQMFGGKG